MTCQSDSSFLCVSSKSEYHWFWILLPIGLLIVCLLYILSRPNYARLPSCSYQLITPTKHIIKSHPQKQQGYSLNQHAQYSIPTSSSSGIRFEQCKERTKGANNCLLPIDNTTCKTTSEFNKLNGLVSSKSINDISLNNCNNPSCDIDPYKWTELRTPVLTNYPDIIESIQARRLNNELNPSIQNHSLLPSDIVDMINRNAIESQSNSNNINLGRIWFFLEYNPYLRQLYLTIIKARNLRSIKGCRPTTFVRAEILPQLNTVSTTDVIRENSNPDYMSEATFNINLSEFPHNVLKLTVHEIDQDVFHIPIGTVYYPLDHLFIAQRAKGHAVWRDLLPEYGDPSAVGLIQIRSTVFYDDKNECLNIYVHSLRSTGIVQQVYQVYVHASVAVYDNPILPEEHVESSQTKKMHFTHGQCGPIVALDEHNDTLYDQLFRFNIYKHEFDSMTIVLDVYRRSLGDAFFNDILLGRIVLVSPDLLSKDAPNQDLVSSAAVEEAKTDSKQGNNREATNLKKSKRKKKNRLSKK